jgi:hypothetical protein
MKSSITELGLLTDGMVVDEGAACNGEITLENKRLKGSLGRRVEYRVDETCSKWCTDALKINQKSCNDVKGQMRSLFGFIQQHSR